MKSQTIRLQDKPAPQKLTGLAADPQATQKLIDSKCAQAGVAVGSQQGAKIATQILTDMAPKPPAK